MQNLGGQTKNIMAFFEVAYSNLCVLYLNYNETFTFKL